DRVVVRECNERHSALFEHAVKLEWVGIGFGNCEGVSGVIVGDVRSVRVKVKVDFTDRVAHRDQFSSVAARKLCWLFATQWPRTMPIEESYPMDVTELRSPDDKNVFCEIKLATAAVRKRGRDVAPDYRTLGNRCEVGG